MRMPLIDGHGNFGSVDNDPPAAMRYTESRLQSLTDESLLEDIESETVDFLITLTVLNKSQQFYLQESLNYF